ncbi:MAG: HAD family phosphatase [Ruminococcus sp.]|nr:HAD family phosphatase [Ruminococcus sp.]
MKYKMIAVDIDDTLLNSRKELSPRTKNTLIKAQQNGIRVVIATGRMPYGAKKYAEMLDVFHYDGYYMSFNGGAIFNARGECISRTYLDRRLVEPVYSILRPTTATVVVHKDGKMYADRKVNPYTDRPSWSNGLPLNLVDDIAEFVDWDLHKIVIVDEPEKLKIIQQTVLEKFGKYVDAYFSAPYFLEVMPKGINKGKALEIICMDCGLDLSEVIAFGDNFNDVSMIETAGLGIAMGNAEVELKNAADFVTDDCDHDGIALALERFVF